MKPTLLEEPKKKARLTIAKNTPFENGQLLHILQKTPKDHIYQRPGKGGGKWDYVTGTYVKKVLNYVFGWMWNFEVKEHLEKGDAIIVLGRLTAQVGDKSIVKEQWGRAEIKYKKDGNKIPLDYGNDLKAATTDALKKCASEFGIASDIYGAEEFKEIDRELFEDLPEPIKTKKEAIEVIHGAPDKDSTATPITGQEEIKLVPPIPVQPPEKTKTPDFKTLLDQNKNT